MRGHAAKFGSPENQSVIEHSPGLEVTEEGSRRLVEDRAMALVVGLQRPVGVPVEQAVRTRCPGGAVEIHVAHTAFEKPAGEGTIASVGSLQRVPVAGAVAFVHGG